MSIHLKTVRADSIREGDQFLNDGKPAWTALSNAYQTRDNGGELVVGINVQHHPDGGLDTRWFPSEMEWSEKFVRRAK